jgi:hypothetical protein
VKNFTSVLDRDLRNVKISKPASVSGRGIRVGDETKITVEIQIISTRRSGRITAFFRRF